jgi:hypothetical protein
MRAPALAILCCVACAPATLATQGGAGFKVVDAGVPLVSVEKLFAVCWPQDALASQRVKLSWLGEDVIFEPSGGASNSTGRCLREIAVTVPRASRPAGVIEVAPPAAQPIDGWAVLAWVKLLSSTRFTAERGLLDPGPLVRACLERAGGLRPSTSFLVRHVPEPEIRVIPSASSEAERCVEAMLGATAWPSSRELFFELKGVAGAPPPAPLAEVEAYFSPGPASGGALDPSVVKDSIHLLQPKVALCWNTALSRRIAIQGSRTFRFRVDQAGAVARAWVAGSVAEGPVAADVLLDRCLAAALKTAHFPPAAGDGIYSWVFASR